MAAPNPGLLAAMLKAQRLNGLLRWKVNFTESGFKGEVNLAGWNGLWLETTAVKSIQDFVDVVSIQSSNPELVGGSLNELATNLFSAENLTGTMCVAWSGWQDLVKSNSQDALEIAEALDVICQEQNAVVLVCDSLGTFPGIAELSQG